MFKWILTQKWRCDSMVACGHVSLAKVRGESMCHSWNQIRRRGLSRLEKGFEMERHARVCKGARNECQKKMHSAFQIALLNPTATSWGFEGRGQKDRCYSWERLTLDIITNDHNQPRLWKCYSRMEIPLCPFLVLRRTHSFFISFSQPCLKKIQSKVHILEGHEER